MGLMDDVRSQIDEFTQKDIREQGTNRLHAKVNETLNDATLGLLDKRNEPIWLVYMKPFSIRLRL
jgi:hypothetical protein